MSVSRDASCSKAGERGQARQVFFPKYFATQARSFWLLFLEGLILTTCSFMGSWSNRMGWVGRDLKAHPSQPVPWAVCPPASPGCPGPIPPGLGHLQGWGTHSFLCSWNKNPVIKQWLKPCFSPRYLTPFKLHLTQIAPTYPRAPPLMDC